MEGEEKKTDRKRKERKWEGQGREGKGEGRKLETPLHQLLRNAPVETRKYCICTYKNNQEPRLSDSSQKRYIV